jgi:FlaA1/EpsC-like NDP-sugar epimerase
VLYHLTNGAPPSLSTTLAIGSNGSLQLADSGLWWKAQYARLLRFGFRRRIVLIIAAHVVAFAAIYPLALLVRFDLHVPPGVWRSAIACLPLVVGIKMAAFIALHSHRGWWRYATFADSIKLAQAATLGSVTLLFLSRFSLTGSAIPRSVILIDWAATFIVIGGIRAGARLIRQDICQLIATKQPRRSLVVGTGDASVALVRELHDLPRLGFKVIGILDSDRSLRGSYLAGLKVVGSPDQLQRIASQYRIETVLIPTPAVSPREVRSLVSACNRIGVKVQIVPGFDALLSGAVTLRPRDVDIHDLLYRDPVHLDGEAVGNFLRGRVILITGAAGSIGSELCRQVLAYQPGRLILLDHCENGLFHLKRELDSLASNAEVIPLIASITDAARLRSAFGEYRPDVILHAAAHKHVPLMESNPGEAIKNNVFGTRTLVDEAVRSGVGAFVMISTDKAVRPTSVMGACKRIAEMYVQSLTQRCSTRLVTVRFGNVLGSNGSVIPLFQEQIRRGEPVTVTHPEMTRYFMTIPEAAQLVLQAGTLGRGGEIFVLDMGEPVKILDLANDLIRLSGQSEDEVEIVFTGLRPGEKLFEELYDAKEMQLRTPHPKIFRAQHHPCDPTRLIAQLEGLAAVVNSPAENVIDALKGIVPEYRGRQPGKEPSPARLAGLAVADPVIRATDGCREAEARRSLQRAG